MESSVTWRGGMAFEAALDGHTFMLDADPEAGGHDLGPRPKGLVMSALAGCTAMDIIAILQKMRLDVESLRVTADGVTTEEHPKRFVSAVLRYEVTGKDLPPDRVQRAVQLSQERYCGVSATLRCALTLSTEIWINGVKLEG